MLVFHIMIIVIRRRVRLAKTTATAIPVTAIIERKSNTVLRTEMISQLIATTR